MLANYKDMMDGGIQQFVCVIEKTRYVIKQCLLDTPAQKPKCNGQTDRHANTQEQYEHSRHCMIPRHYRVRKHVEKMVMFDVVLDKLKPQTSDEYTRIKNFISEKKIQCNVTWLQFYPSSLCLLLTVQQITA